MISLACNDVHDIAIEDEWNFSSKGIIKVANKINKTTS